MKILVVGSGGREHALAWKLRQSPRVTDLFCAPGNGGTASIATNVAIPITDHEALLTFAKRESIDLTVVGPDDALAAGIVDRFEQNGLRIFGPNRSAARLESSKIFAKEFMQRHGIPTAHFGRFNSSAEAQRFSQKLPHPVVVKADGLALGKGVVIARAPQESALAIYRMIDRAQFGAAGKQIIVEEFLEGRECSIHALIDGRTALLFPTAQDHKRVFDGNTGPNTGGMGAFSPAPFDDTTALRSQVLDPLLAGLREEQIDYRGLIYPGLMITSRGIRVLEFNARFGDPETQALLPRLQSDLLDLLEATIDRRLDTVTPRWDERAAVCVVLASGGYPGPYETGRRIDGLDAIAGDDNIRIFHAGTRREADGSVVTSGGRVLGVTGLGSTLAEARDRAYAAIRELRFEGCHYRSDIAA
jgi:phosphoribosylamine--glycine ligase